MKKPIIGITVDAEPAGGYAKLPWYALRENYADTIREAGGAPILLPHEPDLVDTYLDLVHGLLITGGAFDVDPALFGAKTKHETVVLKHRRTAFELAVTRGALERDMPILGICGGQQLLHVVLGGKLIQHIPDEVKDCLAHEQPNPRTEPGHTVAVKRGSLLHRVTGVDELAVNSAHHQAALDAPEGVEVSGRAPDGVIEAVEVPGRRFCLGVQWHPEYHISEGDGKILAAFVDAARSYGT